MYEPRHFQETRVPVLHDLIRAHPLGALVTLTADGLNANHVPFEIDPEPAPFGTLRAHVARANPLWQNYSRETEVLVIFQGPGTYVSPSYYETKKETGKVVPTWNYAVVHAYGALRPIEDRGWLRDFVGRLTARHESARRDPWHITDAPADYIEQQLNFIVGLEIPVARMIGKWKMSQNRPAKDRPGVIEGLARDGAAAAAAAVELANRKQTG